MAKMEGFVDFGDLLECKGERVGWNPLFSLYFAIATNCAASVAKLPNGRLAAFFVTNHDGFPPN